MITTDKMMRSVLVTRRVEADDGVEVKRRVSVKRDTYYVVRIAFVSLSGDATEHAIRTTQYGLCKHRPKRRLVHRFVV